jgi:hypothetical protein
VEKAARSQPGVQAVVLLKLVLRIKAELVLMVMAEAAEAEAEAITVVAPGQVVVMAAEAAEDLHLFQLAEVL